MYAPLLNDIAPPRNAFVLPQHKMVYVPVTKVACSSLRWMVADLAGEDFNRYYRASGAHQSRLMTIHSSRVEFQFAPRLSDVPAELLAEISRDNGWFIFAAIRDPWTRLWSAWQSKMLVQHTPYVRDYGNEPWFPRIPKKPSDILDDWFAFVEAAPWRKNRLLMEDPHFRYQAGTVHPRTINYTKIYDLHDMSNLLADIHTHLRALGLDRDLYMPRANENPVPMTAEALEHGVADRIRVLYKRDFNRFPDRWDLDKIKVAPGPLTMDAVNAVAYHASANERIGDLARELQIARARVRELEQNVKSPPASLPPPVSTRTLKVRARGLARRIKRRLVRLASSAVGGRSGRKR
jgi:hypothetical protein